MLSFFTAIAIFIGGVIMVIGGIALMLAIIIAVVELLRKKFGVLGMILEYILYRRKFRTWFEEQKFAKEKETISEAIDENI